LRHRTAEASEKPPGRIVDAAQGGASFHDQETESVE
jgi:hypothetical protein